MNISEKQLNDMNIINLGFVKNLKNEISSKKYFISPTIIGSGIRIKVLEALSLSSLVLCTKIDYDSVENFKDMTNIVKFENYHDFKDKIIILEDNYSKYQYIKKNGKRIIDERLNWKRYTKELSSYLNIL